MLSSIEKTLVASRRAVSLVVTHMPQSASSLMTPCHCASYSNKASTWKVYQSPKAMRKARLARIAADIERKLPPKLSDVERKKRQALVSSQSEVRQEFKREISEFGDPDEEPSPHLFDKTLTDYVKDVAVMKDKMKTRKMTKKHYADFNPTHKEMSLLTWAEKETIRYLHDSEPETWTPEALSEAFPISKEGARKLIKGSMRLRRVKDVINHDKGIAQRIADIKSGKIEMTEELERRLKIRDLCGPLKVGDLGMHPDGYVDTSLPKELGEYARLVAPRETSPKVEEPKKSNVIADGDFLDPGKDLAVPLKQELNRKELAKILRTKKQMTFSEFESHMKQEKAGRKAADMKFMLEDLQHINEKRPASMSSLEEELEPTTDVPVRTQKYPSASETGQIEVNLEGEQAYLYNQNTGYQKPFSSDSILSEPPMKIDIPKEHQGKPGATYKVGNCYYDENGEFLYRVI